jgi:uncharacterized damage-inducible protein DinB
MNAAQFIRQQVAEVRGLNNAALAGLTDEQFNWLPPGTINPIKSTLLHAVAGEDLFFQLVIQGQPPLWGTGGWADKIGLAQAPGGGQGWQEAKEATLELAPVLAYAEDMCTATNEYLERLTDEELDRRVNFFGRESSVADVLARFVAHTVGHTGEIAAVKGMQGLRGLPF